MLGYDCINITLRLHSDCVRVLCSEVLSLSRARDTLLMQKRKGEEETTTMQPRSTPTSSSLTSRNT